MAKTTKADTAHDTELASHVRDKLVQLRGAIMDAQEGGLTVEVPELVHLYLQAGVASGAIADWHIRRDY